MDNILEMIQLLIINDGMIADELCQQLDINVRTLRRYRQEVETLGLQIVFDGKKKNGEMKLKGDLMNFFLRDKERTLGTLDKATDLYAKAFSPDEAELLKDLRKALMVGGIYSRYEEDEIGVYKKQKIHSAENQETERLLEDIHYAIKGKRVLKIKYHSIHKEETTERDIDPYAVFDYNGVKYVVAFCHKANDYRTFHVLRFLDCFITRDVYIPRDDLNLEERLKGFGLVKGEPFELVLHLYGFRGRMAKEKSIDDTQVLIQHPHYTELRATVKAEEEILSLIISMCPLAKIVEPQWFKEKVITRIKKSLDVYKNDKGEACE